MVAWMDIDGEIMMPVTRQRFATLPLGCAKPFAAADDAATPFPCQQAAGTQSLDITFLTPVSVPPRNVFVHRLSLGLRWCRCCPACGVGQPLGRHRYNSGGACSEVVAGETLDAVRDLQALIRAPEPTGSLSAPNPRVLTTCHPGGGRGALVPVVVALGRTRWEKRTTSGSARPFSPASPQYIIPLRVSVALVWGFVRFLSGLLPWQPVDSRGCPLFTSASHPAHLASVDDFKPASVTQQTATLSLSEDDSHVTVSHGGDASVQPTIFEGPRKDCTNECVLIFDPETNTFVLERIASSVSVKRVRGAAATAAVSKRPNAANGKGASLAAAKRAARPSTPAAAQSSKSPKVSAPTDKALDGPAAAEGNSRAVSKSPVPPAPAATSRPTSAASLRSGPSEPYESSSGSESTEDEGVAEFKARIARKRASANSTPVSDGGPQSGKRARMPSPSDSNRLLSVDEIRT